MVVLNRKLRVYCEYMMLTLTSTATIDQLESIASTRWLGHYGIRFFGFSGFSVMACLRLKLEYKKPISL